MATNDTTDAFTLVLTVPETLALYRALRRTIADKDHCRENRPGVRGAGSDYAAMNRIIRSLTDLEEFRRIIIPTPRRTRVRV